MGADGHLVAVKREAWDANAGSVKPGELSLYEGEILGVPAVWGYAGDNLIGCGANGWSNYGEYLDHDLDDAAHLERRKAALAWFEANAEWTEVWT